MILYAAYAVIIFLCLVVGLLLQTIRRLKNENVRDIQNIEHNHALELKYKDEHISRLEEVEKLSEKTFRSLSNEALRQNNEIFMQIARSSFNEFKVGAERSFESSHSSVVKIVEPLIASLKNVDQKITDLEKQRIGAYEGLKEQLQSLTEVQRKLGQETTQLAKALRTPSAKGRWGEMQLKRVVEMAGMLEHCDFETQVNSTSDTGAKRPDMIVNLPGNKQIVVDAKVPIHHYLLALEEKDEHKQSEKFQQYVQSLRKHIQVLSQKSYWDQFENTPEFVILFLPGEVFFSAALQADPTLIDRGIQQKVILATPTTLIAMLRAVSYGWQQENMSKNAKKISALAQQLVKRLSDFGVHFKDVGRHFNMSVGAYNRAVGSFDSRVIVSAKKLAEMGVGEGFEIPAIEAIESDLKVMKTPDLPDAEF